MTRDHVTPSLIRARFSISLSNLYKSEVNLYERLIKLVNSVNEEVLQKDESLRAHFVATEQLDSLSVERHGAIRLGTDTEMNSMARMLAVMGMYPTGFYDLGEAGLPILATCFRPHTEAELAVSPFRIFTSLLQLNLITSPEIRDVAARTLRGRSIFTERALQLLHRAEVEGGLDEPGVDEFVHEMVQTFRWQPTATVNRDEYQQLSQQSPLLADIVAFRNPHINHLTPRTLDLDLVQERMAHWDINAKDTIEGPPQRTNPILLRQTSFLAVEETVDFPTKPLSNGSIKSAPSIQYTQGHHRARFGEIEQRGAALTPKGRALYDQFLKSAREKGLNSSNAKAYAQHFDAFPDDFETMIIEDLAWVTYKVTEDAKSGCLSKPTTANVQDLLAQGYIQAEPQTYQDFLPISAAGIFQSNLNGQEKKKREDADDPGSRVKGRELLERAIGQPIKDEMDIYADAQRQSLESALRFILNLE